MTIARTTLIQRCVERLAQDGPVAREELLRFTHERLLVMVQNLMARYPRLRRWEQSDDILANVHVRLLKCLDRVTVTSVVDLHWYHGLRQGEVAALLNVSLDTVKRRWMVAKVRLAARLGRHASA